MRDQIKIKIGASYIRLENVVNVAKNILNRVRMYDNISELESEESAAQGQSAKGLKILTPDQMLNRFPISLAQLNAGNIQKSLKTKSENYCILFTDQKNLQSKSIKL